MSTKVVYDIHLSSSLWDEETVAGLMRTGHTISVLDESDESHVHLYVGHQCWRVPSDITKATIQPAMDLIIKQARILLYGKENTNQPATSHVAPKPKVKRKAKPQSVPQGGDGPSESAPTR